MQRRAFLASFLYIFLGTSAFKPEMRVERRNAILISWDGALREHVRASLLHRKLPNLARLTGEGTLVDIDVVGHQTDTKSGHAQMLTGYDPKITGVYGNNNYRPIPRGYTIFERFHQALGKHGITTIMLTGKDRNLGSQGPTLTNNADPYYLVRSGITVWDGDRNRPANAVGEKAVRYIDDYAGKGRFFLFIHFADIDANGHKYGESSDEYDQALVECDRWLGKIMDQLEARGIDDRTLVYVTADHGFTPGVKTHSHATNIFLGTNDPKVTRNGQQRDIMPSVLASMGIDYSQIVPALPGKPLFK
jgi:predicted AlkP superfamily pyrophosphatase or phosphodiesterase